MKSRLPPFVDIVLAGRYYAAISAITGYEGWAGSMAARLLDTPSACIPKLPKPVFCQPTSIAWVSILNDATVVEDNDPVEVRNCV